MKVKVGASAEHVLGCGFLGGGTPVFGGTRVPIRNLLDCLEGGYTIDEFLEDFPTVCKEKAVVFLEKTQADLELAALA